MPHKYANVCPETLIYNHFHGVSSTNSKCKDVMHMLHNTIKCYKDVPLTVKSAASELAGGDWLASSVCSTPSWQP